MTHIVFKLHEIRLNTLQEHQKFLTIYNGVLLSEFFFQLYFQQEYRPFQWLTLDVSGGVSIPTPFTETRPPSERPPFTETLFSQRPPKGTWDQADRK